MTTFKQFIAEILDKPAQLKTVRDGDLWYRARAEIGGRELEFRLDRWPIDRDHWNFTFVELSDDYEDGETYDATGKGSELAVFATAKKFLENAIKTHHPKIIHFESEKSSGSRDKLYKRFVERWHLPGYTYRKFAEDDDVTYHGFVEDEFYKKTYGTKPSPAIKD